MLKEKKNERNKELNQYRYTATTVHPESQVWVSCTQLWVSPLAGYLLWLDTSISQIPPLARYLLWVRYLLWLEISVGQTPSITWHLLRQHISFGNIYLSAAYLLWQNISSSNISPLATYLLWQHISSSNMYCFSHSSETTKQFPSLLTDCFLDCPMSILPLWGVGEFLHFLLAQAGGQLTYSLPVF